jgi:hypothetical protein
MFALGLILPVCFVPGITGATIPTQWVLLSIILALSLWRRISSSFPHELGAIFCIYAGASALWAHNIGTSVLGLWYIAIWVLSFRLGAMAMSLCRLWQGLAVGLSVSTIVAVFQWLGFQPVPVFGTHPSGLLFNSTLFAACCTLVLLGLIGHRLWLYTPPLVLGLLLAQSRGAILVLIAVLVARYANRILALGLFIAASIYLSIIAGADDSLRLALWGQALHQLTLFGWGPDAFNDFYFIFANTLYHGEFVHNDYIQLLFEFGIGALPIFAILAMALSCTASDDWPVILCWALFATFYFPLYAPLTAFIGCVVAGHLLRGFDPVWAFCQLRRLDCLSRVDHQEPAANSSGLGHLPVVARTSSLEG